MLMQRTLNSIKIVTISKFTMIFIHNITDEHEPLILFHYNVMESFLLLLCLNTRHIKLSTKILNILTKLSLNK